VPLKPGLTRTSNYNSICKINSFITYSFIYSGPFNLPTPAAAGLLGLRVRTPPETWTYVSCIRVLSGRGLCDVPIPPPEESFRVCVTECDQVRQ